MPKAKRNIGREILEGLREIKRGKHGRVVNLPSVTSIREKTGLSQERFATLLGVSVRGGGQRKHQRVLCAGRDYSGASNLRQLHPRALAIPQRGSATVALLRVSALRDAER